MKVYKLQKTDLPEAKPGQIVNAAILSCAACRRMLGGHGGGSFEYLCEPCGDAIVNGKAQGCIVWGKDT